MIEYSLEQVIHKTYKEASTPAKVQFLKHILEGLAIIHCQRHMHRYLSPSVVGMVSFGPPQATIMIPDCLVGLPVIGHVKQNLHSLILSS